jgi:hypothetical protein
MKCCPQTVGAQQERLWDRQATRRDSAVTRRLNQGYSAILPRVKMRDYIALALGGSWLRFLLGWKYLTGD